MFNVISSASANPKRIYLSSHYKYFIILYEVGISNFKTKSKKNQVKLENDKIFWIKLNI